MSPKIITSCHYRCRTITLTLCIEQYLVLRNLGRSYIFNKFPNFFNIIGIPPNCLMFVPDQWHFFKIQFHLRTFCWFFRLFRKTISPPDFLLVFPPFWTANGVGAAAYPPPYEVTTVIRINFFLSYSSTSYLIFMSCYLILCRQSYTLYLILTDVCMISHTIIISFHIVRCTTCHITNGSCFE